MVIALLLVAQSVAAVDVAPPKGPPKEVAEFIDRRAYCNHFLGEEPYDAERAAELAKTIGELRCASIDRDERSLRRAFRKRPAILRLLDKTADALP